MGAYLKKSLISATGHTNECWRSIKGDIDLLNDKGVITLIGFKDGQACADKLQSSDVKIAQVDLSQIPEWGAFYQAVAAYLVINDATFQGGTIEQLPDPTGTITPDPIPTPDPVP